MWPGQSSCGQRRSERPEGRISKGPRAWRRPGCAQVKQGALGALRRGGPGMQRGSSGFRMENGRGGDQGQEQGAQSAVTALVQGRGARAELVRTRPGGGCTLKEERAGSARE